VLAAVQTGARGATLSSGRDEETAPSVEQRNCAHYQVFADFSGRNSADPEPTHTPTTKTGQPVFLGIPGMAPDQSPGASRNDCIEDFGRLCAFFHALCRSRPGSAHGGDGPLPIRPIAAQLDWRHPPRHLVHRFQIIESMDQTTASIW
jgi:hypothetical protein